MITDEKEPVPAPCDLTLQAPYARHSDWDRSAIPVTQNVVNHNRTAREEFGLNFSYRRFDAMLAWLDAAKMCQRANHSDCSVSTHPQVADVIKEDHASCAFRVGRRAKQSAHNNLRAARLTGNARTKLVVFVAKKLQAFCQRSGA